MPNDPTGQGDAAVHEQRAQAFVESGRLDDALASYDRAIALDPARPDLHHSRGNTLLMLGRFAEAVASYDKALLLGPAHGETCNNRGVAFLGLGQDDAALASFDKALALQPGLADAHNNRASALLNGSRDAEALVSCDQALALRPDFGEAHNNRGNALLALRRAEEAVASYDRALAFIPNEAQTHHNRGTALLQLGRSDQALSSFDRAVALRPNYAEAHNNRALVLVELKRLDEALVSYERALALKPDDPFLAGTVLHTRMRVCDWSQLSANIDILRADISAGKPAALPFALLSLVDEPQLHRRAAEIYVAAKHLAPSPLGDVGKPASHDRIRIGYFSSDFREHAMAYLLAEMFESHDRSKFEAFGFSIGPSSDDAMRRRIAAGLEHFIDVRDRTDVAIAQLARGLKLDVAVDINGHTQGARLGILAAGCAPVQVNFPGYAGTIGAEFIDYNIVDKTVVPAERQGDYTEKLIYLPHTFQVNDSKRKISDRIFSRAELGLPDASIVFCCFNNNHKILPATFDIWMRLLKAVDGSVLWLLEDNPTAARNLRKEAAARGVDGGRLVFAERMPLDLHLARHRAADLFLDTLPYNAHTTASDALWAGLPVLTCMGRSFASRVAASLLFTVGLHELVTETAAAYEAKARALANNKAELADIRRKLAANRVSTPLFDGKLFARHLEVAFTTIHARHQAGLPPEGFAVA